MSSNNKTITRRALIKSSLLAGLASLVGAAAPREVAALPAPPHKPQPDSWNNHEVTISWIGHSTVLINFFGTLILTDPVMYSNVGVPFLGATIGPTRMTAPALTIAELPKPDIVLLSHGHMDHTDWYTLSDLTEMYPGGLECVTAYNTADITEDLPWKRQQELDWGQQCTVEGVTITALKVKHFGWRYPWEKDRSKGFHKSGRSFNAYLLEKNGRRIVFGGDTALTDSFRSLQNTPVDVAIMPIGAYNPWIRSHCTPEEALAMAQDMNARYMLPVHCMTFKQSREPFKEPVQRLASAAKTSPVEIGYFLIGSTFTLPEA